MKAVEILAEMRLKKYRGLSTVTNPSAGNLREFIVEPPI